MTTAYTHGDEITSDVVRTDIRLNGTGAVDRSGVGYEAVAQPFTVATGHVRDTLDAPNKCPDGVTDFASTTQGSFSKSLPLSPSQDVTVSVLAGTNRAVISAESAAPNFLTVGTTTTCGDVSTQTEFVFGGIYSDEGWPGDNGDVITTDGSTIHSTYQKSIPVYPDQQDPGTTVYHVRVSLTRDPDADHDGVPDSQDTCPTVFGTLANGCPDTTDPDGDGVPSASDNCPNVANADQADLDQDHIGDACDPDIDGDGSSNADEAKKGTDPRNPDTDGDGQLDGADPCPLDPHNSCNTQPVSINSICKAHFTTVACTFSAVTTGLNAPMTYAWSFGDGTPSRSTASVAHTFARKAAGVDALTQPTDVVTLRVTSGGHTSQATLPIVVGNPWRPLLLNAVTNQDAALQLATDSASVAGYYDQIVNLLCASSHSFRAECQPLVQQTSNYTDPGLTPTKNWAGEWIWDVFNDYLGEGSAPTSADIQDIQNATAAISSVFCSNIVYTVPGCGTLIKTTDIGALVAGLLHFSNDLQPSFDWATNLQLGKLGKKPGLSAVNKLLNDPVKGLRTQHTALFHNAVAPGFSALQKAGVFSSTATLIGQQFVPRAAGCLREQSIKRALETYEGKSVGDQQYNATNRSGVSLGSLECKGVSAMLAAIG